MTLKSSNAKTGKIPVTTTSVDSCPPSCPWLSSGCYANSGPLLLHWKKVGLKERGSEWNEFLASIKGLDPGQLWRHNQAGDLPGKGDKIHRPMLKKLVNASAHTKGFTYTHKKIEGPSKLAEANRNAIREANSQGFTINLSANSVDHADRLARLQVGPVTTVVASTETRKSFNSPGGNRVVVCPAAIRDDISCAKCGLCAVSSRKSIVAFPAHGSSKKKVDSRLRIL